MNLLGQLCAGALRLPSPCPDARLLTWMSSQNQFTNLSVSVHVLALDNK